MKRLRTKRKPSHIDVHHSSQHKEKKMEYSSTKKTTLPDISDLLIDSVDSEDDLHRSEQNYFDDKAALAPAAEVEKNVDKSSAEPMDPFSFPAEDDESSKTLESTKLKSKDETKSSSITNEQPKANDRVIKGDERKKFDNVGLVGNESHFDFVSRIRSEMASVSLKMSSIGSGPLSEPDPVAPPYLHTAHRSEERLRNNQLRLLHDSDLKILLDPMELPIYTEGNSTKPAALKLPKKNFQTEGKDRPVERASIENSDARVRVKHESTSEAVKSHVQATKTDLSKMKVAKPAKAVPTKSLKKKSVLVGKNKPAKRILTDSSLQCSLIGDNSCESQTAEVSL